MKSERRTGLPWFLPIENPRKIYTANSPGGPPTGRCSIYFGSTVPIRTDGSDVGSSPRCFTLLEEVKNGEENCCRTMTEIPSSPASVAWNPARGTSSTVGKKTTGVHALHLNVASYSWFASWECRQRSFSGLLAGFPPLFSRYATRPQEIGA